MSLTIAIGADHGGFPLKRELSDFLEQTYTLVDFGAYRFDPDDDYPDFSLAVASAVASGQAQRGILVCGSGVGACIAANKIPGARAGICNDTYSAQQGVEHNDMNILCLGANVVNSELSRELVKVFLKARFCEKARYRRRLDKVLAIEKHLLQKE